MALTPGGAIVARDSVDHVDQIVAIRAGGSVVPVSAVEKVATGEAAENIVPAQAAENVLAGRTGEYVGCVCSAPADSRDAP